MEIKTRPYDYDVAETLRTPDEMAAYWKRVVKKPMVMPSSSPRPSEILQALKA